MPLFKCSKCHHEWEGSKNQTECDWCGAKNATILELKTALEQMLSSTRSMIEILDNIVYKRNR